MDGVSGNGPFNNKVVPVNLNFQQTIANLDKMVGQIDQSSFQEGGVEIPAVPCLQALPKGLTVTG